MRLRGATGEVRWSYMTACVFGPWLLEGSTLTGSTVSVDLFRITQTPLHAVLMLGKQQLTYEIESIEVNASTITAYLGARKGAGS